MNDLRTSVAFKKSVALLLAIATTGAGSTKAQADPGNDIAGQDDRNSDKAALQAMRERNARIQLANYPREALKRGEQGIVGISVTTDRQGRLRECSVSQSSGSASLDAATCDFLFDHVQIRAYLAPGGGGAVKRQQGQVVWQLPEGFKHVAVSSLQQPASQTASSATTKKICRVQATTGSLIASQRICLTREQWQRQYALAQDATKDMHSGFLPGD